MFSYRHGFHAGNHADVLKHLVLVLLLESLTRKDKAIYYIDTHAGAGDYALDQGFAAQSGEWQTGIGRLWTHRGTDPAVSAYLEAVAACTDDPARGRTTPTRYPGSPLLAQSGLREHDRLRLYEAHTTEIKRLRETFGDGDRRLAIHAEDGFAALKSQVPPPSRRALVLMDPSYEDKRDYASAQASLRDALRRFPTGVYALWYPMVARPEARALPDRLRRQAPGDWLDVRLQVKAAPANGLGLFGSGMFIYNPPWQLDTRLAGAMPVLRDALGEDGRAGFELDARIS